MHSRREQAETELANMTQSVGAKRAEELAVDGMVIEKARYGDLSTAGGYIDATDQLQHLVDGSVLIHKGNKDFIEGMWDPTFMRGPKQLEIMYQYAGNKHFCIVDEEQDILLPMKDHELSPDEVDELRSLPEVREQQRLRKMRARRAAVIGAGVVSLALCWWFGVWPFGKAASAGHGNGASSAKKALQYRPDGERKK